MGGSTTPGGRGLRIRGRRIRAACWGINRCAGGSAGAVDGGQLSQLHVVRTERGRRLARALAAPNKPARYAVPARWGGYR